MLSEVLVAGPVYSVVTAPVSTLVRRSSYDVAPLDEDQLTLKVAPVVTYDGAVSEVGVSGGLVLTG